METVSPHATLLQEIDDVHALLLTHARTRQRTSAPTTREQEERIGLLTWWGAVIGLVTLKVLTLNVWLALAIALLALALVGASVYIGATSFWREWTRRRVETLESLTVASAGERPLITALLPHSRAALLHVAAAARAADARVGTRLHFLLGPNRAGGVLGALVLVLGIFSAGKYLQDNRVALPLMGTPITADHIVVIGATLLFTTVALLVAGASVASLNTVAELLERVAALKKNMADEPTSGEGRA